MQMQIVIVLDCIITVIKVPCKNKNLSFSSGDKRFSILIENQKIEVEIKGKEKNTKKVFKYSTRTIKITKINNCVIRNCVIGVFPFKEQANRFIMDIMNGEASYDWGGVDIFKK